MSDARESADGADRPGEAPAVSPDNPCPFLRAAVANGFVDGGVVPLAKISHVIAQASGEKGARKVAAGVKAYFVALIANGVGPFRLFRTWWSGVELDALRDGPLDKHGVGSRILDAHAHIDEAEIQRLAEFGSDRPTADGGVERGLDTSQIKTYMDATFARGAGARRWFDRGLMEGEWPILHRIMGKGEGDERDLSVEEVRTLFVQRRFPARIVERLRAPERERLRQDLQRIGDELLNQLDTQDKVFAAKGQADTEEGYGRLDALNRIGNQVFWLDFAQNGMTGFEKNLHARDAPVRFPQIWNVPWFRWSQYDASIGQPLVRNAGEALGVAALVNFSPDGSQADLFQSSIAFENLTRMEAMLGGPNPLAQKPNAFGGLASPKWPSEIFWKDPAWKIDGARVARGRALYAEICAECHLGPINDPEFEAKYPDRSFWASEHWTQSGPVFKTIEKSVAGMGTDPAQSEVLGSRRVDIPGFLDMRPSRDLAANWGCTNLPPDEGQSAPFSLALMDVVDKVARKWMADSHLSEPDQDKIWNGRSNCPNQTAARHYRVRPLNGIWATAPYLHNGSIPSLYWMLKPAAERPKQFCVGARDFDPEQVGIRVEPGETPVCAKGETRFSTVDAKGAPIHGNSNLGHSLEGPSGSREAGIIGRGLSEEERYDLIEYLKTL